MVIWSWNFQWVTRYVFFRREDLASQFQVRTSDVVKRSKELIAMMMSKRG